MSTALVPVPKQTWEDLGNEFEAHIRQTGDPFWNRTSRPRSRRGILLVLCLSIFGLWQLGIFSYGPETPAPQSAIPVTKPESKKPVRMAESPKPKKSPPSKLESLMYNMEVPKVIPPKAVAWPVEKATPKDLGFLTEKRTVVKKKAVTPRPKPQPVKKKKVLRRVVVAPVTVKKSVTPPKRTARPRLIYQQLAGSPRDQGSIGKPVVSPQNPAERERLLRWARDRFSQAISSDQELQRCLKDPICLYAGEVLATSSDNERFMLGIH